ncbi:MAG TPA: glycoside hydrolase family 3 N-terminal domain-containing protein, partial [Gemmatimonadales bacterium]
MSRTSHRSPLLLLAVAAVLTGPAQSQQRRTTPEVSALMRRMTLAEKAAQLVMPWVAGGYTAFDDPGFERIVHLVDSLKVGGIVVSIGSPMDIAARINHLQRKAKLPLLVASDLEGGSAFRVTGGTAFPTNMGVGAGGQEADAYLMGRIIAEEGRAIGVHLTFSPVADVNNNPSNPIINTRSFGGDSRLVARLVEAQVRGTQEHGLLATAKHFPGHGDTGTDSHLAIPVITADWNRIDSLELVPFRAAIGAGVAAVMSAHVALPGLDSGRSRPATMVPEILTGILRDSLGFTGLIVTDALDMAGVVSSYGAGEAAVSALRAGSDILLMPTDPVMAVRAVVSAVEEHRISRARLDSSVRRVLTLKSRMGLFRRRLVNLDSVGYVVGRRAAMEAAAAAARRSLVLLRDSLGLIDSLSAQRRRIAIVSYSETPGNTPGAVLAGALRSRGHLVSINRLLPASGPASHDSARAA